MVTEILPHLSDLCCETPDFVKKKMAASLRCYQCGKRSRPVFMWQPLIWITSVVVVASLLMGSASATSADGCDWIGSGLENPEQDRGVQPVYLKCSQGSVTWLYPRGALRVVLRYGTHGKEFQGCLKLSADFAGANIYVERHRILKLLHSGSSLEARPDGKRHCFQSHRGQVALFLESDPGGGGAAGSAGADPLRRQTASFEYDLQLNDDSQHQLDPWEECRPCSVKETLDLFCSSDFVARGSISSIYNDAQLERTLMTVRATRVIRQASSVFQPLLPPSSSSSSSSKKQKSKKWIPAPSKWKGMDGVEEDLTDNDVDDVDVEHVGTLHLPLSCQVKHGGGQFLFMGRKRLGDAVLWCAPRLEEWKEWVRQAQLEGSAQCRLES